MRQTAVWLDKDEAQVFHVDGETFEVDKIHAAHHHLHRHPKAHETKARNHPLDETRFFDEVLAAVSDSEKLLLLGPSVSKLHLLRYAQIHAPAVAARVVGIETLDHPTDRQLAAHVRHYFHSDPPRLGVPS